MKGVRWRGWWRGWKGDGGRRWCWAVVEGMVEEMVEGMLGLVMGGVGEGIRQKKRHCEERSNLSVSVMVSVVEPSVRVQPYRSFDCAQDDKG
ncbi:MULTISPECIES: hypothetical protein [Sphingobacterium]|uniref:Uncharacterized protein n=1 Tax=Sphingobacterium tenebrionis TaxID=3111775 RepID=A0ABU8I5H1_9SPHI|nr:hypothetical protein [Sphingobacterium sp. 1.A.4]